MKICYLILAHNNPDHLRRLISAVRNGGNGVYVHIDLKASISDFLPVEGQNVEFIRDRIPVYWGDYSIVQATLNLMYAAVGGNNEYEYYCLLSGSHYPIRSQQYISSYLEKNYGREFINIFPFASKGGKPLSKISYYHLTPEKLAKLRLPGFVNRGILSIVSRIKRDYKKGLRGKKPYSGSQWWTLSRPAVLYIVDYVQRHKHYARFFKRTHIPDESFFHTILGNSSFIDKKMRNCTFTEWNSKSKRSPSMIHSGNIQRFKQCSTMSSPVWGDCEILFARKFSNDSAQLVESIHHELW